MNIYDYQNRSLTPLFAPLPYSQPIKREKNKKEYIRSLNLLLIAIERVGEIHSEELKKILPYLTGIVDSDVSTPNSGYQEWIEKRIGPQKGVDINGPNIKYENNDLNELENLLLILVFQNFQPSKDRYKQQIKRLLKKPKDSAKTLVEIIRTKTHENKSKYNSLVNKYGINYIHCYFSLQILFLSAYNESFEKFLIMLFKENHDERFEEYKQQERKKGIRLEEKEMYQQFLVDKSYNGSSYYQYDIYSEFIKAVKNNELPQMEPFDPPITSETLTETYTVLADRDVNWWLLEKMKETKLIHERNLFQREIDNYPLFSLLDVVIAEVFLPGINELYADFISVRHAYERSDDLLSNYLSSGYGRLSYLLTCADNGKYSEDYWF